VDCYRLRWEEVLYEPGAVKAVAYRKHRKLGESVVRTADAPARLRLTPDRKSLRSDGDDLCYVLVEATDRSGTLCPLATHQITCKLEGPASIAGVGNGDHHFPAEFDTNKVSLFYGKAMVILRSIEGQSGQIQIEAIAEGLSSDRIRVRCR